MPRVGFKPTYINMRPLKFNTSDSAATVIGVLNYYNANKHA
jgi:hypothetical protein